MTSLEPITTPHRSRPCAPAELDREGRDQLRRRIRDQLIESEVLPEAGEVAGAIAAAAPLLPDDQADALVGEVMAAFTGLGALEALLVDDEITDILVNGPGPVWVERCGELSRSDVVLDEAAISTAIERITGPLGLRCDPASPMVDARLPDGSRVHAVVAPLAIDGPCLAIRRFRTREVPVGSFCEAELARCLHEAVAGRRNVIVSGGTGTGKTTLLNALSTAIPSGQRVVTIEEAAELRLRHPHVVRLEARPANAEGIGEVTVRALVRASLRLRPDRIIVGECRGGEAVDMLQAMNTGHAGSMSTVHANSPDDALRRLETMVLLGGSAVPLEAVREQLMSAIDLVVQVVRSADGSRSVQQVAEVERRHQGSARTRRVA